MSPKKKVKSIPKGPQFCKLCAHVINPRNLSVTGEPTLGTCPYEEFAILYQRECANEHYKPK
jgi:hypothetical protein|nr:MAG TPA: RNA polymerase I [Caudoviricetes sp.]